MDSGIFHKAVFYGKILHDILGKEIEKVFVRHYNEDKEQEKRLVFFYRRDDMATKVSRKKRLRKHMGSLGIVGIVLLMLLFVSVASLSLRINNAQKQAKIQELEKQIAAEEEKAVEIEEYRKYVQTKKYAEEVAKEKLGLVYEDEIIFKAEE